MKGFFGNVLFLPFQACFPNKWNMVENIVPRAPTWTVSIMRSETKSLHVKLDITIRDEFKKSMLTRYLYA